MCEGRNGKILQFKITLKFAEPLIWRKIQVPGSFTFEQLHLVIQLAMGWRNSHLHNFKIDGRLVTDHKMDVNDIVETEACIKDYFKVKRQKASYHYDFGDGWDHIVELECIVPAKPGEKYPKCIAGKRACPPEGCGGIEGYNNLLEVLKDPSSEDYEEMKEWLEELGYKSYDPAKFMCNGIFDDWQDSGLKF